MGSVVNMGAPVPMLLWCPECGERHVDGKDREPHRTHACQCCGMLWRPALIHTVGVHFLPGCLDEPEDDNDDAEDEEA